LRAPKRTLGRASFAICVVLLVLPATTKADPITGLRSTRAVLQAREQAALLQLYALSSSLDRARGELADAQARVADVRRQRAAAGHRLRAARRTLRLAQQRLGAELRRLYESGRPDVLAIIFGATSLADVITGLDTLGRAADSNARVVAQTRDARAGIARALAALKRREARLGRLRAEAAARSEALDRAAAERIDYVAGLRSDLRLTSERIAQLEARARAAEAVSTVATVKAQAVKSLSSIGAAAPRTRATQRPAPPPPPPVSAPTPIQPASGSGRQLTVVATAYSLSGSTASGLPTGPGVVAVDPTVIPLGTRMIIPGYGNGIAADTGTAIKGLRIDLWFPTLRQAQSWGRRSVTITVL
jgi:3D (Asp-Asp-Asp) domain-containing protein/peptidoglycan hydrolase CwlO-like protein